MAYPYIGQADIEGRLSKDVVQRIYDDNNDGVALTDPVTRLCADASSKVASYLRAIYDLEVVAAAPPHEVIRLSLDVATAYAFQRFPEYVRGDWEKLMAQAEKDLDKLRKGVTRLDVKGPPEPAKNEGGTVRSGDPVSPTPRPKFFLDGTGDF